MLAVSPSPTPQDEDDQVLFVGQIAGIVIGVSVGTLLLVIITVLVAYCLWYVCVYMHTHLPIINVIKINNKCFAYNLYLYRMHHKSGRFSFIKKGAQKNSDSNAENVYQLEHSLQGTGRLINK